VKNQIGDRQQRAASPIRRVAKHAKVHAPPPTRAGSVDRACASIPQSGMGLCPAMVMRYALCFVRVLPERVLSSGGVRADGLHDQSP